MLDVAEDSTGLLDRHQVLRSDLFERIAGEKNRFFDSLDVKRTEEFRMVLEKTMDVVRRGLLAYRVGHIDRKEVRTAQEAIDGFEADMVRIGVPGKGPTRFPDGMLGCGSNARRFGSDEGVFAVRFIPNRHHLDSLGENLLKSPQLRGSLVGKAIANAEREPGELKHQRPSWGLGKGNSFPRY